MTDTFDPPKNRLPDAVNADPGQSFTQISNTAIRDPNLSWKAKGLLAALLSNRDGWFSFSTRLETIGKDGPDAIRSGLSELEESGYLARMKYRDATSKRIRGSFWVYTSIPGEFLLDKHEEWCRRNGMEIAKIQRRRLDSPNREKPNRENPYLGESKINNTISKEDDNNNNSSLAKPVRTKPPKSLFNQKHYQLTMLLVRAIEHRRKLNRLTKTDSWPAEIAKLCRSLDDPKPEARVHRVIKFLDRSYAKYGLASESNYIPTVESVRTLKEKFSRIEDAMDREAPNNYGRRIIARDRNETVLAGGEPILDGKWFPAEDIHINGEWMRTWENGSGDRVACDTYPQPDPDGPVIGVPVSQLDSDLPT